MYNMLKPGGDSLHWAMAYNPSFELWERLAKYPKWQIYTKDIDSMLPLYYKTKDAVGLAKFHLEQSPFEEYEVIERDEPYTYKSVEMLKGYIIMNVGFSTSC